jgi:hypothetical protein
MEAHAYANPSTPLGINHLDPQYKINSPNPTRSQLKPTQPTKTNPFIKLTYIPDYTHPVCRPRHGSMLGLAGGPKHPEQEARLLDVMLSVPHPEARRGYL